MSKIEYHKLVRDQIIQIINSNNKSCTYHVADDDEYVKKLEDKLLEEVTEFIDKPCIEEMADILEVLSAINRFYSFTDEEVQSVKKEKLKSRGGFEERIVLEEVFGD